MAELKLLMDEEIYRECGDNCALCFESQNLPTKFSSLKKAAQNQAELTAREILANVNAFDIDSEGRAVLRMPLEYYRQLRKQIEGS